MNHLHTAAAPSLRQPLRRLAAALTLLLLPGFALAARDPGPAIRIPLNPIGYQSILPEFLAGGSALFTVHFADSNHILLTFALRHLVPRNPNASPKDDDHLIGAFLLELPSGKVLARTEWLLHDRGQYLWDLGSGRFLLRIRSQLSVLEPLHAARPEDALRQLPFLHIDRPIVALNLSSDHDLLTLQTEERPAVILGDTDGPATRSTPVQINFFRLRSTPDHLTVTSAGILRAPTPVALPVTSAGLLEAVETAHDHWKFHFNPIAGKPADGPEFDTSCYPRTTFVSHEEFVALSCRGADDRQALAAFTLSGDFMWQQNFTDNHVTPIFAFAPAAGRFLLSRTLLSAGLSGIGELTPSEISGQEVRVYQTYNGRIVFRTALTPAMRTGQNVALSPDGLQLAVAREVEVQHKATKYDEAYTAKEAFLDIYTLPGLSKEDLAAVDQARKLAPPDPGGPIDLAFQALTRPAQSDTTPAAAALTPPSPAAANPSSPDPSAATSAAPSANSPASSAAASSPTTNGGTSSPAPDAATQPLPDASTVAAAAQDPPAGTVLGDPIPNPNRSAPTLYAPGEKPQTKPHPNQ